jgi:hypothetical protein
MGMFKDLHCVIDIVHDLTAAVEHSGSNRVTLEHLLQQCNKPDGLWAQLRRFNSLKSSLQTSGPDRVIDDIEFLHQFHFGPAGIQPAIDLMGQIFNLIQLQIANDNYSEAIRHAYSSLKASTACLLSLVKHFRSILPREDYAPPGFAGLFAILHNNTRLSYVLTVCILSSNLL